VHTCCCCCCICWFCRSCCCCCCHRRMSEDIWSYRTSLCRRIHKKFWHPTHLLLVLLLQLLLLLLLHRRHACRTIACVRDFSYRRLGSWSSDNVCLPHNRLYVWLVRGIWMTRFVIFRGHVPAAPSPVCVTCSWDLNDSVCDLETKRVVWRLRTESSTSHELTHMTFTSTTGTTVWHGSKPSKYHEPRHLNMTNRRI